MIMTANVGWCQGMFIFKLECNLSWSTETDLRVRERTILIEF